MSTRAALASGTVLSVTATAAWSWTASLTVGPAAFPRLTRSLPADYAGLAAAPAGNGPALFAVLAVIYAACFLASGLRARRRALREAAADLDLDEDEYAEAVLVSAGRRL